MSLSFKSSQDGVFPASRVPPNVVTTTSISMLSSKNVETLQKIVETARQMTRSLSPYVPRVPRPPDNQDYSYSLPAPQPITPKLVQIGFRYEIADRLSQSYLGYATALKHKYEQHIAHATRACSEVGYPDTMNLPSIVSSIRKSYSAHYSQQLQHWVDRSLQISQERISELRRTQDTPDSKTEKRSAFKQGAIPILEDSFDQNPYPSRCQKMNLARLTGLEFKQIHVWFQNRRSRSKRDGHELRKPSSGIFNSASNTQSEQLDVPQRHTLKGSVHDLHPQATTETSILPHDVLNIPGAKHAFPSPYPPLCSDHPFPIDPSVRQLALPWPRRASGPKVAPHLPIDAMDTLVDRFAELSTHDESDRLNTDECGSHAIAITQHCSRVGYPFAVFPATAPLPSLIRAPASSPPVGSGSLPSRPSLLSSGHPFQSSSSFDGDRISSPEPMSPDSRGLSTSPKTRSPWLVSNSQRHKAISRSPSLCSFTSTTSTSDTSSSGPNTPLLTPSSPPADISPPPSPTMITSQYRSLGVSSVDFSPKGELGYQHLSDEHARLVFV